MTVFVPFVLTELELFVLVPVPTVVLVDVRVPPWSVDVLVSVAQPANNAAAANNAISCFIILFPFSSLWTVFRKHLRSSHVCLNRAESPNSP